MRTCYINYQQSVDVVDLLSDDYTNRHDGPAINALKQLLEKRSLTSRQITLIFFDQALRAFSWNTDIIWLN